MASGRELLDRYVEPWKEAVDDVVALLRGIDENDWGRPTDLPGWDVRAVAAHLAHVEAELAGLVEPLAGFAVSTPGSTKTVVTAYTEAGVRERAGCSAAELVDELERAAGVRYAKLRTNPPTDPAGAPPRTPGGVAWDWETLLGNRVLDVWMHDQDIRRAVDRPGAMGTAAARHTGQAFSRAFFYTVGKRVAPPEGTSVVLDVTGERPIHLSVGIRAGRAVPMPSEPPDPAVRLRMGLEAFVLLAGGRRPPDQVQVEVGGDRELAHRVLAAMAVTP